MELVYEMSAFSNDTGEVPGGRFGIFDKRMSRFVRVPTDAER